MKIVTWNTQACTGLDGRVDPARIVHGARSLADFDVLCLQEIAVDFPALTGGMPQDQPALLRRELPGFQLFFGAAVDAFDRDGTRRRFGNVVATRLPVAQLRHHPLPFPPDPGTRGMPRMCTVLTVRDPALGAVRVMTTHLEFYSTRQRLAQARALQGLHAEYCAQADLPPVGESGAPGVAEIRTRQAVLCGDFNLPPASAEYAAITASDPAVLRDAWPLVHGGTPHEPTFCVHEQRYLPQPVACDLFFLSEELAARVRHLEVDSATRASDHQPVLLELG